MTTFTQEQSHKTAVALAEGARQAAVMAAKAAYTGLPATQPAFDAAIKAADAAAMRAIIASCAANGLGPGPSQSLYWLTGSYT